MSIHTDPKLAYEHARDVIKGRFPEGEAAMAANAIWAYNYASHIIKGRFPEAEAVIAIDARWAYHYSTDVIKGRFPEAEAVMLNSDHSDEYLQFILPFIEVDK